MNKPTIVRMWAPAFVLLLGCGSCAGPSVRDEHAGSPGAAAQITLPRMNDTKPSDLPGLHNVVAYHDNYYSGAVPEGDQAFATLKAMGIKTIISVDGAEPDLERAKAAGIRYIHLPFGYNGPDDQRRLEVARASRDALADGPVYVHCHHGKHRSACAAAASAVALGWLTPEQALAKMKVSGTAANYTGLYAATGNAHVLSAAEINAVGPDFPEISRPAGFVKAMLEIDEVNDHLKLIERAGWRAPSDHPDLAPASEAGKLADLLRFLTTSDRAKREGEGFTKGLAHNSAAAQSLEEMLLTNSSTPAQLSAQFKLVGASCKDCHAKYRD
jgi:protein tyrosine phosphatase (PTP) superfamily phosphohydrolase (DUF442 family)